MKTLKLTALAAACLLTVTLAFAGCAPDKKGPASEASGPAGTETSQQAEAPAVSAADCAAAIAGTVKLPEMVEGTKRAVSAYYGVEAETLKDYKAMLTSSGATADEIAVLIAADEKTAGDIAALLEQRRQDQIVSFTGYVDSEVPRLKKAKVGRIGTVCYFICTDDPTAGETALKKLIG